MKNYFKKLFAVASAAFFIAGAALAQTGGAVTSHAFAIGKGPGTSSYTSLLCGSAQLAVGQSAADPICRTLTGDVTLTAAGVTALGNIPNGTTAAGSILWSNIAAPSTPASGKLSVWNDTTNKRLNDKNDAGTVGTTVVSYNIIANQFLTGLNANGTFAGAQPTIANISGWGTGVATALGVNVGTAGSFVVNGGVLGTPSSGTATNLTGLPVATGISGLGAGIAAFLATPSSANLRTALTDEVGTGAAYFVGGALGTPASGNAANFTGLPVSGLAAQAAYTFIGNNTGSSAVPTAVDIALLTTKGSPAVGDFVILSDQSASGAWKKATVSSLASAGSVASVNGQAGSITTDLSALQNCSLAASVASSALTIALKDAAGSDPTVGSACAINFRNATASTGTFATLAVTAANSLVISSGSTLGTSNNVPFRIWIVAINDAGTFRISAVVATTATATGATIRNLNDDHIVTSTAEGGAGGADNAQTFYTGTAVTAKPMRILGYMDWDAGLATAGTWSAGPDRIQIFGPGIHKPGEQIQTVLASATTETTNATNAFVNTSVTAQIVPRFTQNLIKIEVSGSLRTDNASGSSAFFTLARGTTAIGPQIDNALVATGGAGFTSPMAMSWIDNPATTSATTYNTRIKNNDSATTIRFPRNDTLGAGAYGSIILTELMG